jgi:hypothetical protein
VRGATLLALAALCLVACNDLRDFRGAWRGPRVGDAPELHVGVALDAQATLTIDALDTHGISGRLAVDSLVLDAHFASLPGAEADALAGITYSGSPLRVYLAFVAIPDSGGEALALIALYEDRRVEVRLLRGGSAPLYAIFALTESD